MLDGKKYAGNSKKKVKFLIQQQVRKRRGKFATPNDDLNNAVKNAKIAFEIWSNTPPLQRARVMFKFKELIEKNSDELTKIIVSEHGKVYEDAKGFFNKRPRSS